MDLLSELGHVWHYLLAAATLLIALVASGHAVLYKRDPRAAMLWVGFIWILPLVGAVLYFILGVNRIRRHAVLLRGKLERYRTAPHATPCKPDELEHHLPAHARHLTALARVVHKFDERPLVPGNHVVPRAWQPWWSS